MLIPCFVTVAIINMDRLQSFKAGNFEAQFREQVKQVEKVIEEAHVTMDQLKEMTIPLLDYTLANVVKDRSIFTGVAAADKERFYSEVLQNVEKFNIESENTSRLLDSVRDEIAGNYIVEIQDASLRWVGAQKNEVVYRFFNTYQLEYDYLDHSIPPRPSHIKKFYEENDYLYGGSVGGKIDQYENFFNKFFME